MEVALKIALLGDVALLGRFDLTKNGDAFELLKGIKEQLTNYDFVVANLETPLCNVTRAVGPKSAHIRAPVENIEILNFLGVTHVTLANNHMGDYGYEGFSETKRTLDAAGIEWFGCDGRQARLHKGNDKAALLGFCAYNTNPLLMATANLGGVNPLELDAVVEQMSENESNGYVNILAIHSGQEHVSVPSIEDVQMARQLAQRFDYIYYGHHPHVIQGMEKVNGSLISYSLGNCIFDDSNRSDTAPRRLRDHARPLWRSPWLLF